MSCPRITLRAHARTGVAHLIGLRVLMTVTLHVLAALDMLQGAMMKGETPSEEALSAMLEKLK